MTENQKTWSVLTLVVLMLLLVLWLFEKKKKETATQTSVDLGQGAGAYSFPVRNENNQILLRQCTYTNGHTLTLDPNAAGGQCPPVFTDLAGVPGNLVTDQVIAIPNAGQSTVGTNQGGA
jgi:hypothetical protein